MTREELKDQARAAIVEHAPELVVRAAEELIQSPMMQRWFDRIEKRRPRGIVAWVRRMRGAQHGLTDAEKLELETLVRSAAARYQ